MGLLYGGDNRLMDYILELLNSLVFVLFTV